MPKKEGMKIPKEMIEKYGYGVGINYPMDEFLEAEKKEDRSKKEK